ncbi:AraC family transcriptional regulator [Solidesulfovibrio carbinolicus]|uniref:AraC family transcriptional regulator n=1 Tax=Solidesulfovibrio carbinolicus TaxID=296842 RepID=A0A4P6HMK0_9BACT|nr:AraC family transcriptional regulator [Solidesulfovibrio carbinolicus]QAZ67946.1 AraC family transcriptional regulator [Solidesulfovibrio carbinolicus]
MSEETRKDWRRRVLAAMRLMEARLDEELSLGDIAGAAHFSPYHFHRIFVGMTGETVGAYLRRLRLERAAQRLCYGDQPVTAVALEAGFESPEAFARAFRAAYATTPSAWRQASRERKGPPETPKHLPPRKEFVIMELDVVIKTLPVMKVACVRHVGPYDQCEPAWTALCAKAGSLGLFGPDTKFIGIGHDDPQITPPEKIRYDACMTVPDSFTGTPDLPVATIGGRDYASAVVKGPYTNLAPAYAWLCGVWGPDCGREFAMEPSMEIYLNDPKTTPPDQLLTEILVPIGPAR